MGYVGAVSAAIAIAVSNPYIFHLMFLLTFFCPFIPLLLDLSLPLPSFFLSSISVCLCVCVCLCVSVCVCLCLCVSVLSTQGGSQCSVEEGKQF